MRTTFSKLKELQKIRDAALDLVISMPYPDEGDEVMHVTFFKGGMEMLAELRAALGVPNPEDAWEDATDEEIVIEKLVME